MRELGSWASEVRADRGTWLILGKGPSLERLKEYDLDAFRVLSLNHVVSDLPVEVASAIDLDVVRDCADAIDRNARFLLMPRHPHVATNATDRRLEDFFGELPVLEKLDREGRLVWYNLATGRQEPTSQRIPNGYFSAEVVVNVLATVGVRAIRTLGIDGGTAYSPSFAAIEAETRFANRHASFDLQWQGIAATVRRHDIDYAPLTSETPIQVFVGCDASQRIAARVLEYSIRKHCPVSVRFDTMEDGDVSPPRDPKNQPKTDFAFKRFDIPRRAGYRGRALYLDADMLVLRNLLELWDVPCGGAKVLYAPSPNPRWPGQLSVLKLDCEELEWRVDDIVAGLDDGVYDYDSLMRELCIEPRERVRPGIPAEWNSLELYEPGRTGLIHYTHMSRQPWVSCRNPNGDLWVRYLAEAVDAGFVSREEVEEAVAQEFVRPSLPVQLRLPPRAWPVFRRTIGPVLDLGFRPHRKLKERLALGRLPPA